MIKDVNLMAMIKSNQNLLAHESIFGWEMNVHEAWRIKIVKFFLEKERVDFSQNWSKSQLLTKINFGQAYIFL